jgi:hypothetical protein|tara:strand:+ start:192 stop:383 length:192 start_codon:yes stop_codon:yes gene_type:complete
MISSKSNVASSLVVYLLSKQENRDSWTLYRHHLLSVSRQLFKSRFIEAWGIFLTFYPQALFNQ